jgi:hypothetical protein
MEMETSHTLLRRVKSAVFNLEPYQDEFWSETRTSVAHASGGVTPGLSRANLGQILSTGLGKQVAFV